MVMKPHGKKQQRHPMMVVLFWFARISIGSGSEGQSGASASMKSDTLTPVPARALETSARLMRVAIVGEILGAVEKVSSCSCV